MRLKLCYLVAGWPGIAVPSGSAQLPTHTRRSSSSPSYHWRTISINTFKRVRFFLPRSCKIVGSGGVPKNTIPRNTRRSVKGTLFSILVSNYFLKRLACQPLHPEMWEGSLVVAFAQRELQPSLYVSLHCLTYMSCPEFHG